ncbi:RNA polymerase sigma-70 factor, ECF subfamily [Streptoalloteichus tenebrarius]|uniref:RNA polymerase sigma-70 factor, ECF subfamily n=1 Tax=Streptoalloteichus tenebrarius (strain ATCC 17920 / DSM 40477 / JCM 4838 / CBS 697.72 / NBRC 16177 / NCIMB 11028 / NRRL B-12390 / A12253. 1 / ISP 5477) TaxID=1933 RepID=A0ABT1HPR4_STRSD|nr:sigma-70 family RNA polymerase sigma factor [Streptoalloteichus tenebrarius]MCP2257501.1 RNA polymerase sigma-70 factor, ECF subfamily [Streptoalloteichus tenebrarius]BFE98451.1 sigma-70 family RNA polymerase sigma factor [Streptoalloteichus tenebrarius]
MHIDSAVAAQRGSPEMDRLDGPDDLAALYDRHARPLHAYLAGRVGAQVADDLVAEAFLVLWEQRARFDPERASLRAWLYGVATNLLRNHARAEVRRLRAWTRHGAAEAYDVVSTRAADRTDAGALSARLAAAIAGLRAEERDVLLLVAWADLTPAEIAEVRGVSPATVRTRLHRARTRLRSVTPDVDPDTDAHELRMLRPGQRRQEGHGHA